MTTVISVAGVDGCKGGWIAVHRTRPDPTPGAAIFSDFQSLVAVLPPETIVAVDMPIGLPDRVTHGGRGPETAARRHLGERQSSVFSIPSRNAVYAETGPFSSWDEALAAHRRANAVARATSDPPKSISIQAFFLFPKIREIDAMLRDESSLRSRIVESHPELAFWRLNNETPMHLPKKIKGRVNPSGMEERRALLARHGLDDTLLHHPPPRGAGEDDFLDACAMMLIAERHALGLTQPFPDPPLTDSHGIQIAIWA